MPPDEEPAIAPAVEATVDATVDSAAAVQEASEDPAPEVAGYQVERLLGRGGMGAVWQARDVAVNRVVALKLLHDSDRAGAQAVARFRFEAEATSRLDHPAIVPIYQIGLHQSRPFFTMKLVPGGTLSGAIPRLVPDPVAGARVLAKVARAIHHAHQRGVLHRDLKPANILIDESGAPHVTDFGLARNLGGDEGLTRTGQVMGTPGYMAPEQASGDSSSHTTAVDVYGLGAVLYDVLTGRPPFRAGTPLETLVLVRDAVATPPSQLNPKVEPPLEAICQKCLEKRPEDRYQTAEALADDLEAYVAGDPVAAYATDTSSYLMRVLLRQTRHVEVMAQWGRVWLAHAVVVMIACLITNLMLLSGVVTIGPYLVVWVPTATAMLAAVWFFRVRAGLWLTPLERQIAQIWTMFGAAYALTAVIWFELHLPP